MRLEVTSIGVGERSGGVRVGRPSIVVSVGGSIRCGVGVWSGVSGRGGVRGRSGVCGGGDEGSGVFADDSVEATSASSVVDSTTSAVRFEKGVLSRYVVSCAVLHLAFEVTGVGISNAVGEAGDVGGNSRGHEGEDNKNL